MLHYEFPFDITLDEVRTAIANANQRIGTQIFIEADRGDFLIFNYAFSIPDLFPAPNTGDAALDREYAVLRECRGLTFHKDGRIAARKFHKFFNLGEKAETQIDVVDWSVPHRVLMKEDGSMIAPVMSSQGLEWHTKMGNTDVAQKVLPFISANPQYVEFAKEMLDNFQTPLFEWCSRSQRIVLDYPEDNLILIAIRDNRTGRYWDYTELAEKAAQAGVSCVENPFATIEDPRAFQKASQGETGIEGYIIRFDNGHMLKIKTEEYCLIHGTVSDLASEKNILGLIVSNTVDDALSRLAPEDQEIVLSFVRKFHAGAENTADLVMQMAVIGAQVTDSERAFANWAKVNVEPLLLPHVFRASRGGDVKESILHTVEKHLGSSTRINMVRPLWGGHAWEWGNQMAARVEE